MKSRINIVKFCGLDVYIFFEKFLSIKSDRNSFRLKFLYTELKTSRKQERQSLSVSRLRVQGDFLEFYFDYLKHNCA